MARETVPIDVLAGTREIAVILDKQPGAASSGEHTEARLTMILLPSHVYRVKCENTWPVSGNKEFIAYDTYDGAVVAKATTLWYDF